MAMKNGYKGACKILYDQGIRRGDDDDTDEEEEEVEGGGGTPPSRETLPQYLFKEPIDKSTIKRPDLVMIMKLHAQCSIPEGFVPPKEKENNVVHLVEVSYTHLANYQSRYSHKHAKYLDIVQELRTLGWDPLLHVIILGTLGEIPRELAELLTVVGVKDNTLATLQKDLHNNAILWMDKCIDTELALSHWDCLTSYKRRKKQ
jgi:hypothetical protein